MDFKVELSIVYSLKCDLKCSFCMYDCSPKIKEVMDINKLKIFLKTRKYTYFFIKID